MCQIQYNYLDEHIQAGLEGLMYATDRDVAVFVMEPLRGGSLIEDEINRIESVRDIYKSLTKIPCTACVYCMPCPAGVNIPLFFENIMISYVWFIERKSDVSSSIKWRYE